MPNLLKNLIRFVGSVLLIIGITALLPLAAACIYGEWRSAGWFLGTAAASVLLPLAAFHLLGGWKMTGKIRGRDGFLFVSVTWIAASLVAAVPLCGSGAIPNFADAFFETCSGFSTTGSSILSDVEALPNSMLFWRSFLHWLGGMGIIVFSAAILPDTGIQTQNIASAETPGPTLDKLTARFRGTAQNLYILYFAFTIVETILLMLGGMSLLDALIQTFGTVGTGGLSNYNNSIGHFTSPYLRWVIIIFMILCGTNFNLYFIAAKSCMSSVKKKFGVLSGLKRFLMTFAQDAEFRLYLLILTGTTAGITADLLIRGIDHSFGKSLTDAAFHIASIMTTTGYSTTDYDVWPTFSKMMLLIVFLTGASSSSTGGGPKIIRIAVAIRLIRRNIHRALHPREVYTIRLNGKPLLTETATNIANFLLMYFITMFLGMLVIAPEAPDLLTAFSASLTCLGNIGPGFSAVGPTCNFGFFSSGMKVFMGLLMIAGRLELFTFFMLFSPSYWNANRS